MKSDGLNILLIDDDQLDRTAIIRQLRSPLVSHSITCVDTGEAGLVQIRQSTFDVILLDYRLNSMTGLDVLTVLNDENLLNAPVIMLSGMNEEPLMLECLEHGAQDFLIKAEVNEKILLRAIRYAKERQSLQQQLLTLAKYDSLTGLANRELFINNLALAISKARRRNEMLAVMFIDLDHFKQINDTMGHAVGDQLLVSVSKRLKVAVRDIDMVARLGGDEFAVILEDIKNAANTAKIAEKILQQLKHPHHCSQHVLTAGCSIGIATFPTSGMNCDALLQAADTAMYVAKNCGRNDFRFYSLTLQQQVSEQTQLENALQQALENNQFVLQHQPLIDAKTNTIIGAEAFIRWHNPLFTNTCPQKFLPIAQEQGFINAIDCWVLDNACEQYRLWHNNNGLTGMMININVSLPGIKSKRFYDELVHLTCGNGLGPQQLLLDINENILTEDPQSTNQLLERIHNLGVKIAIDDFGIGNSSLGNLSKLPIDILKIAPTFVAGIAIDQTAQALIKSMISLAHNLNIKIAAENVETRQQADFLLAHGCDFLQGHLFSPVQDAKSIESSLRTAQLP